MTTRRPSIRRVEEEIIKEGVPPQGNQTHPNKQVPHGEQVSSNSSVMNDGLIREALLTLSQVMDTQVQVVTSQAQAMKTQENQYVGPRVNSNASTMASMLRGFPRMNP